MKSASFKLIIGLLIALPLMAAKLTSKPEPKIIADGNNSFAFDLFHELRSKKDGNIFYSPFSISTALAMTYAGADGQTEAEMKSVLHFGDNDGNFHMGYGDYLTLLKSNADSVIDLRIANRLWGDEMFEASSMYLTLTRSAYGSALEQLDFRKNAEKSRTHINDWVADQTEQHIKDLIPSGAVDKDTRMVLTNAIYFKGDWMHEFNKDKTKEGDFHLVNKQKSKAKFMTQERRFAYNDSHELFKTIRLPYKGGKQSMVIALPKEKGDIHKTEEAFTKKDIEKAYNSLGQNVLLKLPKFKMTLPLTLSNELKALGMRTPFTGGADFSKMSEKEGLMISEVIHKAFIEVDEKGTEAAAATAVVMMTTSSAMPMEPPMPKLFVADHPFLFYIVDDETKSILFMGRVMEPSFDDK